jgi:branched-chain amino acid transport system ATP-binding protein
LASGEILALIGPNGAGKTTCFNMINGQIAPTSGQIQIFDRRADGLSPRAIGRLGVGRTFQVAATFASMTLTENVQMALLARHGELWPGFGWAARRRRDEALDILERIARERNIGVLFTEHDMDVVFGHADRLLVLNRGELIAEGKPDEVRAREDVRRVYLGAGVLEGGSR